MVNTLSCPDLSEDMHAWARDLFPICRSLTGNGVRETLGYIQKIVPELVIHEVPSGTNAFDWTVPDEWNIRDAYILNGNGEKVVDFKNSNLHVVGYSVPTDETLDLDDLQAHLYSIPEKPDAIPYITSYYEKRWGFCLSHSDRMKLKPGKYRAVVDSSLEPGSLTYGEIILPGREETEILLSTYVCHPSLANNETSGPVVTAALARWLSQQTDRRHTYRIVFGPETIGAIAYLSRHLEHLKKHVIAGFNISCVGDNRAYTYLASRNGNTLADRTAKHVLGHLAPGYVSYSFLNRGSDERQYCAPGVDLPVASVMRTRFGDYPEYHTSDDNLDVISPEGLGGAFTALKHCLEVLERNEILTTTVLCEPQLGKRGLISNVGFGPRKMEEHRRYLSHLLAYCDGTMDLLAVSDLLGVPLSIIHPSAIALKEAGLLKSSPTPFQGLGKSTSA
jgi:aminopeptidase-like protein